MDDGTDEQCDISVRMWQAEPISLPSISPSANVPCCWITWMCCARCWRAWNWHIPFMSMRWCSFPITCMLYGRYPGTIATTRNAGCWSRQASRANYRKASDAAKAALRKANGASDNGAIGSTWSATIVTSSVTWITSITTRSSMAMCSGSRIGLVPLSPLCPPRCSAGRLGRQFEHGRGRRSPFREFQWMLIPRSRQVGMTKDSRYLRRGRRWGSQAHPNLRATCLNVMHQRNHDES